MLGFVPEWEWSAHHDQIPAGGALVLYTDGVAEARRGKALLGTEGVMRSLQELLREGAESLAEGLRERAHTFAGGEIRDDLAIVALRRTEA
jgi:serine phosphatase RsbU (regulator of sigma subunit)